MVMYWVDSFVYVFIYIVLVFGGKWYMEECLSYGLWLWLVFWSGILVVFSIFGVVRIFLEFIMVVN